MGKTRVAVRLKDAVGGRTKSHYQSEDLKTLTERYNIFVKKLKTLIGSLKAHNDAQINVLQTKLSVVNLIADMAKDSPLSSHVGMAMELHQGGGGGNGPNGANNGQAPPDYSATPTAENSYMSIHANAERKGSLYASKYKQHVIDYVVEWEKVISTRVGNGLKKWEQVRVETDHYHKKVESLRQTANTAMSKGKQVDPKTAERLTRNEEKWIQARQTHQKVTTSLCILLDELVNRNWRDLHPLLVKMTQFDMTTSEDVARGMQQLSTVVDHLKSLAATHSIKPQARLADLQSLDPSVLSTRPDGPPAPSSSLSLDPGMGQLSLDPGLGDPFSPTSQTTSSPLDSYGTGPGSYPVPMPSQTHFSRSSSTGSFSASSGMYGQPPGGGNLPSTLDMVNFSSAPPPTMDQLQGAGMMVPMAGGNNQNNAMYGNYGMQFNRSRNASADSGSMHSDFSAPPPMSAPPPPPPSSSGMDPFARSSSNSSFGAPTANPYGAPPAPASYGNSNNNNQQFYGSSGIPPLPPQHQGGFARQSSNPFDM